jgi:hypothetical protein
MGIVEFCLTVKTLDGDGPKRVGGVLATRGGGLCLDGVPTGDRGNEQ